MADAQDAQEPCAFCRRRVRLTKEHLFPEWIGRLFGQSDQQRPISHTRTHESRTGETRRETWRNFPFQQEVRAVCGDCNKHWMSNLETQAQPVLEPLLIGRPTELSNDDRGVLALWAAKTVMMAQFTHPANRSIPAEHFEHLYAERTPPPNTQVWIAIRPRDVGEWPYFYRTSGGALAASWESVDEIVDPNFHRSTLAIGYVAFHVFGHTLDGSGATLSLTPWQRLSFEPIWPLSETFSWPPRSRLTLGQLDSVSPESMFTL